MNKYRLTPEYPENWEEIRRQVLKRDNYRCGNCGSRKELHVHHIIPISSGGSHQTSNLRTLCRRCHEILHPHMKDEIIYRKESANNLARKSSFKEVKTKKSAGDSIGDFFSNPIVYIGIGLVVLFLCIIFSPNNNGISSTNRRTKTPIRTIPPTEFVSSSKQTVLKITPSATKTHGTSVTGCVSAKYLNIRTGPSDQYSKNGYLEEGDCETFIERNAESTWLKFSKGWVSLKYLNLVGSLSLLPIAQHIPTADVRIVANPSIMVQSTSTPIPLPSSTTKSKPTPTPKPKKSNCHPSYPDVCIPPPPPDLDCKHVNYCHFRVFPPDPHGFDGDGDGWGCERCP